MLSSSTEGLEGTAQEVKGILVSYEEWCPKAVLAKETCSSNMRKKSKTNLSPIPLTHTHHTAALTAAGPAWGTWEHLSILTASCWIEVSLTNYTTHCLMCIITITTYYNFRKDASIIYKVYGPIDALQDMFVHRMEPAAIHPGPHTSAASGHCMFTLHIR